MNGKSFSFKSRTGSGHACRTNVFVDNEKKIITIERMMVSTENNANDEVLRKFTNYMILHEAMSFKESSFFMICQGLYDENALKHL